MALQTALNQLDNELDVFSQHLREFSATKPMLTSSANFTLLDECLLEGLLSRVWQSWSIFCRTCVIESCIGTTTANGKVVAALVDAASEHHVSSAAILAKSRPHPPYWGSTNTVLRVEPTWGDVDVLAKILTRLKPDNSLQLLAAFSANHRSVKALQLIRNGAAHNHNQNRAEIQDMQSAYLVFPISHPTQALFWIEPQSRDFVGVHIIGELKDAGLAAIQ